MKFFYSNMCSHCEDMKPVVEKLELEGLQIEKIDIDKASKEQLKELDKSCGGVPYFTNGGRKICGATDIGKLKELAKD